MNPFKAAEELFVKEVPVLNAPPEIGSRRLGAIGGSLAMIAQIPGIRDIQPQVLAGEAPAETAVAFVAPIAVESTIPAAETVPTAQTDATITDLEAFRNERAAQTVAATETEPVQPVAPVQTPAPAAVEPEPVTVFDFEAAHRLKQQAAARQATEEALRKAS
jgi:hypothetical protein